MSLFSIFSEQNKRKRWERYNDASWAKFGFIITFWLILNSKADEKIITMH